MRFRETFDVRSVLWAALIISSLVWIVNIEHGVFGASTAALKQAAYSFAFGGLILQLCTRLAQRPGEPARVLAVAIGGPALITIAAVFVLHNLRGTPELLLSTLPAGILGPISYAVWAARTRRASL